MAQTSKRLSEITAGPPGCNEPGHPRAASLAATPPAAPPITSTTAATNPASSRADARTPRREAPTDRLTASSGARSDARAAESVSTARAAAASAAAADPIRSRNSCVRAVNCAAAGDRASGFHGIPRSAPRTLENESRVPLTPGSQSEVIGSSAIRITTPVAARSSAVPRYIRSAASAGATTRITRPRRSSMLPITASLWIPVVMQRSY